MKSDFRPKNSIIKIVNICADYYEKNIDIFSGKDHLEVAMMLIDYYLKDEILDVIAGIVAHAGGGISNLMREAEDMLENDREELCKVVSQYILSRQELLNLAA